MTRKVAQRILTTLAGLAVTAAITAMFMAFGPERAIGFLTNFGLVMTGFLVLMWLVSVALYGEDK